MQNKLTDLNNHLFVQLERLGDDEICKDKESTMLEIARAKAVSDISTNIVEVARVCIDGIKLQEDLHISEKEMPEVLRIGNDKEMDKRTRKLSY